MAQPLLNPREAARAESPATSTPPILSIYWTPALVLIAAMACGALVYSYFWQHSRDLWWWMGHDRHTHYMYGLNLAMDIRTGDFGRLFHDFDRMRVWGPLHPFLVAAVQLFGGPDHRLAVLPSVGGWILTILCAFLIPRRMLSEGGTAAGLIAATLAAASPAHRAFATDCMYESLGAGLSLASLYCYLVLIQDQTRRAAILLGVTLSLLFLHKYNYWLLVVFGLTAGEFARQPKAWIQYGLSLFQRDRLPQWLTQEWKQPLTCLAVGLVIAALAVAVTGGGIVSLGKWTISLQEPHNLVHAAYLALFVRGIFWWRKSGRDWSLSLPANLRTLILCHGSVIALWFLLPKRLSYFLWFLSPYNSDQARDSLPFMHGLPFYAQAVQEDYLAFAGGPLMLGAMLALAVLALRSLKPGALVVMTFFLISAYLTCQHPMLKYRLMHSWIASVYVIGAVGLIGAVQWAIGLFSADARPWFAGLACTILIGINAPAMIEPGRAQEGGLKPDRPSPLTITDTYLPALADAQNPTILSNVSARFLWTWTFIEKHRHQNFSAELKNFKSYEDSPAMVQGWLDRTSSEVLLLIDIHPGTTFDWPTKEYVKLAAFQQALAAQSQWRLAEQWEMPEGVSIQMWRKGI